MWNQRVVDSIVNKVCESNGVASGQPISMDGLRKAISESIFQVVSSRDFMEHINQELGKLLSRSMRGI